MSTSATSNPLGEIINLIPWEPTIVDPNFLDKVQNLTRKFREISNTETLVLLESLAEAGFIEFKEVKHSALGRIYAIHRINNGNKE
jgi:hypothetical protein